MSAPLWTAQEIARATSGVSTGDWAVRGVSIDSRSIRRGELFVALSAARDGHDFVADALKRGAAGALVSRLPEGLPEDAPLIMVRDVLDALWALGRAARGRMKGRVIGVTGSVGKTSTKEMLRTALGGQGKVHAAEGSYNNHWGVPLTLARMPRDTDFAVIEIGMNAPGEIAPLSRLVRPHVAMITAVNGAHMAAFDNVAQIAREKAEIFEGLVPWGHAVINRDTNEFQLLARAARKAGAWTLRFGTQGRPEFQMISARVMDGMTGVTARRVGRIFSFKLGAPGTHLAMNALGAMAAVEAVGADLALAGLALAHWHPPAGRGVITRLQLGELDFDGEITLIDESYNANPASMEAALEVLAGTRPTARRGRRIAVLGDMLELGQQSRAEHAGLADLAPMAGVDRVHLVGPEMRALAGRLPPRKLGLVVARTEDLLPRLQRQLLPGDVVMVKGSKGTALGPVVDAIRAMGIRAQDISETEWETA